MDKKLWIPFILTLLATLFMLSCIFIPYATATPEQAEKLALFPDAQIDDSLSLTAKDMQDISMVKYAYMYSAIKDQSAANALVSNICIAMVVLIGVFSLLAILFSLWRKPIPVIIFTLLAYGVFAAQNFDYTDRGIIPSNAYDWGLAHTLFPIAVIIALASAVWMLVTKLLLKKQAKAEMDVAPEA